MTGFRPLFHPATGEWIDLTGREGKIGYVAGSGPLVVLVPGMGDLRSAYRFLSPTLGDNGFRVRAPTSGETATATRPLVPTKTSRPLVTSRR